VNNENAFKQVYNVAVGERFSVNQLYDLCAKELQSNWLPVYREPRAGDIRDSLADISHAQKLLGYQPTKKFEEGLIETVKYFKAIYS